MSGDGVVVLGAGGFAVEVARYLADLVAVGRRDLGVSRFVALDDDEVLTPAALTVRAVDGIPGAGTRVVLAVIDTARRREVIHDVVVRGGLDPVDVVHPSARVDAGQLRGGGNILGPGCYVGAQARLGSFNVVHYHCSVGHHSRIGSNNVFAPGFHCGAAVSIGDDNAFGLACAVAPGVDTGSGGRFQAGLTLFEDVASGHSHLYPSRIKSIRTL